MMNENHDVGTWARYLTLLHASPFIFTIVSQVRYIFLFGDEKTSAHKMSETCSRSFGKGIGAHSA